jgi:hypothetical protein
VSGVFINKKVLVHGGLCLYAHGRSRVGHGWSVRVVERVRGVQEMACSSTN